MKLRETPLTRGLVAVVWHVLLGFFISSGSGHSSPWKSTNENTPHAPHPLAHKGGRMPQCCHSANTPRGVDPSVCIKATLWPFGRPWQGSRHTGWPNRWLLPRSPERKYLPLPIWLVARTWLCICPEAKPLDSQILQQVAILLIEIRELLRGNRGKCHQDPKKSHHNTARKFRWMAVARRYRIASGLDPSIVDLKAWVESSFILPNV